MKVLDQDERENRIHVQADTMDDLWHLSRILQPGDLVTGRTQRRLEDQRDMVRDTGGERVTVTLTIRVETTEFHESTQRLRVGGPIQDAPDEIAQGTHHTISVSEHDRIHITKPDGWPKHLLDRVQDAVDATEEPKVTIVAMDDKEATIAVLHQFGPREIGRATRTGGGKKYESDRSTDTYFGNIRRVLETTAPEGCPVIIVGPGFTREDFTDELNQNPPPRLGSITTDAASQSGMPGVHEALKRGHVERVAETSRISEETNLVEELLGRIARDGDATYGPEQVEHALNMGAVETLLVLEDDVHDEATQPLLDLAHETGATVRIIGTGHDAGQTLESLTGIAALLRYDPGTPD